MGDDQRPDHPAPEGRAPWERYFVPTTGPGAHAANDDESDRRRRPRKLQGGRAARRSKTGDIVSVADLVGKVDPTMTPAIHAITDTTEIPKIVLDEPPKPPQPPQLPPPPADQPPPPMVPFYDEDKDKPKLTRLAMSRLRRRRRLVAVGRSLMSILAVIALVLTGVVWGYLKATDNAFAQVPALDENSSDINDPLGQLGDETYLIVGTDSRAGANGEVGAGTNDEFGNEARSDTVMLVNIPANRKRVVAVSFPRDLDVFRPECQGWDNSAGKYTAENWPSADGDKLNATYALGGPKCLVKVIQKMTGMKIGHFIGMDFSGFESMVNEVGGVEVCSATPLVDYELGTVLEKPGKQTIDGATALNYVRARNIESEGNGDYGRIERQQRFLSSLLRSALSSRVLFDTGKLRGFIDAFTRETFVEKVTTKDLMTLGRSLQNVDSGAVTFLTVPTAGTNDYGNEIPRTDDIKAIFRAIISDDPLPGERSQTTTTTSSSTTSAAPTSAPQQIAVSPGEVSLQVSNASGNPGVAATTANYLGAYGFGIYSVGNFTATESSTKIRYSSGHEAEAATVASAIPGSELEESDSLGGVLEVVLGTDFTGTVHAPTAAGTPLGSTSTLPSTSGSGSKTPELPSDLETVSAADESCN